jgi:hypothetical protein
MWRAGHYPKQLWTGVQQQWRRMVRETSQPLIHFFVRVESLTLFPPVCRYAMERTPTFIKVWFWQRHTSDVPSDVRNGNSGSINTDTWGTPTAYFPDSQCDINSKFAPSNIIINLTFCEFSLLRTGYY